MVYIMGDIGGNTMNNLITEYSEAYNDQREKFNTNSNMYMITIKCNNYRYIPIWELFAMYYKIVGIASKCEWSSFKAIETDKLGRLHLHTIATFSVRPVYKRYQQKNWYIHFKPIQDYDKCMSYMMKDHQNPYEWQQKDTESFYRFNYGFI